MKNIMETLIEALDRKIEGCKTSLYELKMMRMYDWETYLHPEASEKQEREIELILEEAQKERNILFSTIKA